MVSVPGVQEGDDKQRSDAFEHAVDLIEQADGLVIAAGAGMGVDSGQPDFRGTAGFWKAYPALGRASMVFHEIASPAAFRRDPALAWGFYGHRLALYRRTIPHAGFRLLRRWGERAHQGLAVFTSNVDGQFQKVGFPPEQVYECHGSIHHLQCLDACTMQVWDADEFKPEIDEAACRLINTPPRCPNCGALARPNVLMFSDDEWIETRTQGQARKLERFLGGLRRPVVIELGAGTAIPSVRHFSHRVLCEMGGRLIRINPQQAQVPSPLDVGLVMGALEALEGIAEALACR